MLNNKKRLIGIAVLSMWTYAQAEVLVILPESGPMERAGNSIKQGFMAAYQASQSQIPLKFVDETKMQLEQVIKQAEDQGTKIIVGPLLRSNVEKMIQQNTVIKVLALNDTQQANHTMWQFSLSKREDAQALHQLMQQDAIESLVILEQPDRHKDYVLFLTQLRQLLKIPVTIQAKDSDFVPQDKQGILIVGDTDWLKQFSELDAPYIYTVPNAIEASQPQALAVKFCDTPALYENLWLDVLKETEKQMLNSAFKRLLAFGGDAWQISESYLMHGKDETVQFQGRTGQLSLTTNSIHRVPHCYEKQQQKFKLIEIQ